MRDDASIQATGDDPNRRMQPGELIRNEQWSKTVRTRPVLASGSRYETHLLRVVRLFCFGSRDGRHEPVTVGVARYFQSVGPHDDEIWDWLLDPDESTGSSTVHLRPDGGIRAESERKAAEVMLRSGQGTPWDLPTYGDRFAFRFRCPQCRLDLRVRSGGHYVGLFATVDNTPPAEDMGEEGVPVWDAPVRVLEAPVPGANRST